jgi:hypothetical protein
VSSTAKQQLSRNPQNAGYANPIKTYPVPAVTNEDGTISVPAQPVYGIDPNHEPIDMQMPVRLYGQSGGTSTFAADVISAPDFTWTSFPGLSVRAGLELYNVAGNTAVAQRTPTIYRSATIPAATGTTDVWTPAGGLRFRLMGYSIHFAGTAAAVGLRTFALQQETLGDIGINTGTLAPAAGTGAENSVVVVNFPGNGYLATVADKKLQVVTGTTAYNVGADYISVWGTEE